MSQILEVVPVLFILLREMVTLQDSRIGKDEMLGLYSSQEPNLVVNGTKEMGSFLYLFTGKETRSGVILGAHRVLVCSGFSSQVPVYICCPNVIINGISFHSQKFLSLVNKACSCPGSNHLINENEDI